MHAGPNGGVPGKCPRAGKACQSRIRGQLVTHSAGDMSNT